MNVFHLFLAGVLECARAQYRQDLAIEFAKLAGAAYCPIEQLENWTCAQCSANVTSVETCTATSMDKTQAFVGLWKDGCVLSFEGTETIGSMLTDLDLYAVTPVPMLREICNNCSVHAGYFDVWTSISPCIFAKLNVIGCSAESGIPLRVTGHSLGAGVGAIAMMFLARMGWNITESYNIGMPRTGDQSFATNFTATFAGKFWRITHHKDPIIQVPPDHWGPIDWKYVHVEPEVFYVGDVENGYKICSDEHDNNCSAQYWEPFNWDLTFSDHKHYLDLLVGEGGCQPNVTSILV